MKQRHKILELIDAYWKFDNNQHPMSSWHDKQDLLKEVEKALEPESLNLEERKMKFAGDVKIIGSQYNDSMLMEFCLYWTESNMNGKKMRFEKEKVFDISRRLVVWKNNQGKFGNGKQNSKDAIREAVAAKLAGN